MMKISTTVQGLRDGAQFEVDSGGDGAQPPKNGQVQWHELPPSKGRQRFFRVLKGMLGGVAWMISSEGIRLLMPSMGWKFYKAIWPLYYIPLVRKIDAAAIVAFVIVVVVLFMWHYLLRQLTGIDWKPSGKKWHQDKEGLFRNVLAVLLLLFDLCLVYLGICGLSWSGARWSFGAFLLTGIYGCLMVGVTYAGLDAKRPVVGMSKYATLILVACMLLLGGCEPPDEEVFHHRDSEYVVTILVDVSESCVDDLMNGGWDFLQTVVQTYFQHRAGSDDDLITIAKISGDSRTLLWQGSVRDLRERFPEPEAFKEFIIANSGNAGASRVHEAMSESLRFMLADPNVASGRAKSALLVLSDMLQSSGGRDSEAEVMSMLSAYGQKNGVVGLFFVEEDLRFVWEERLHQCGVSHVVHVNPEMKPVPPSFE